MSNETNWVGPFNNPFKATVKALDALNIDTVEFTTYRIWDGVGYYDFHGTPGDFIEDVCAWIAETTNVVVQHHEDGFYARRVEQ